jgi:hypothetical protein
MVLATFRDSTVAWKSTEDDTGSWNIVGIDDRVRNGGMCCSVNVIITTVFSSAITKTTRSSLNNDWGGACVCVCLYARARACVCVCVCVWGGCRTQLGVQRHGLPRIATWQRDHHVCAAKSLSCIFGIYLHCNWARERFTLLQYTNAGIRRRRSIVDPLYRRPRRCITCKRRGRSLRNHADKRVPLRTRLCRDRCGVCAWWSFY